MLLELFSFRFYWIILFVRCGGLSWLQGSFLLHVKYTISYRIGSYRRQLLQLQSTVLLTFVVLVTDVFVDLVGFSVCRGRDLDYSSQKLHSFEDEGV